MLILPNEQWNIEIIALLNRGSPTECPVLHVILKDAQNIISLKIREESRSIKTLNEDFPDGGKGTDLLIYLKSII